MSSQTRKRIAALLEVFGVYLTGAFLSDQVTRFVVGRRWISSVSPFDLLTPHTTNAGLLLASRQMFLALLLIYASFFALIVPINWWRGKRGRAAYGLTRAGRPWKVLIAAGIVTVILAAWPVLVHTLIDAIHPLGAMAPWRQAFFDMSWRRWQFWLFAGILSYAVVPVVEELLFRGYYQRRLSEEWGDGPAIIGTSCLFTFAHRQYLIANAYNVTMIASLLCLAIGLGVVFAWTRSLAPSMIAHAIINVPMTPAWQGALLIVFAVVIFFVWRRGLQVVREVFSNARLAVCVVLALAETAYVIASQHIGVMTYVAMGMLAFALLYEAFERRSDRPGSLTPAGAPAPGRSAMLATPEFPQPSMRLPQEFPPPTKRS